jgi:hypothetical protein
MKTRDTNKDRPERKRGKRGAGRLYKRDAAGKEYKADSDIHGAFWLEYVVNGKRIRQRLLDAAGNSITKRPAAEKERARILAPLLAADKVEQLSTIQAKLAGAEAVHAQAVDEANPPLLIARAWDAYLTNGNRPDTGTDTQARYFGYWDRLWKWLSVNRPALKYLREIDQQTAQDYAATLNGGTVSPNTYNKHTGFLRLFFRVLKDPARITENPFEPIRRKNLKPNTRRELTIAELHTLLESATGELQTLFYIGTFTGLRLGDCCSLTWGEVDLDRGLIRRIPNKTAKSGKPVLIGIPAAKDTFCPVSQNSTPIATPKAAPSNSPIFQTKFRRISPLAGFRQPKQEPEASKTLKPAKRNPPASGPWWKLAFILCGTPLFHFMPNAAPRKP